jgi:hypothetical protein
LARLSRLTDRLLSTPLRRRGFRPAIASLVLVSTLLSGCSEESDPELFDEVGVTRIFAIDPGQRRQSLLTPESVQVTEWTFDSAILELGNSNIDLTVGQPCGYTDTALVAPIPDGPCNSGIVIPATEQGTVQIRLALEIPSMQVRRAALPDLTSGDFDGDGKPNDGNGSGSAFDNPCGLFGDNPPDCDDNCPLIFNPDQGDFNNDGVGDACTVLDVFSGIFLRDSDGDGIPDTADNCVAEPNPGQEDETSGVSGDGIPDGIGDACMEQIATVEWSGQPTLQLPFADLDQPIGAITLITVDFTNTDALDCDWGTGTCVLDPTQVRLCGLQSNILALAGCP